jgi:hypothetical protein
MSRRLDLCTMTDAATLARSLETAVSDAAGVFVTYRDADTSRSPAPGKWCAKEILGHLIDSAANNHRRFVIAQDSRDLFFDGYEQNQWVERQRYGDAKWEDLVGLWRIISVMPDDVLQRQVARHSFDRITVRHVPADQPSTLAFLIADYIQHLQHHVAQIRALM